MVIKQLTQLVEQFTGQKTKVGKVTDDMVRFDFDDYTPVNTQEINSVLEPEFEARSTGWSLRFFSRS